MESQSTSDVVSRLSQAASVRPRKPLFSCNLLLLIYLFKGQGLLMRMTGPVFVIYFYALLSIHVYAHFGIILFVLKKRLGVTFGLLWVAIGAAIFYNVVYNHFFAMIVKPGGPKDLKVSVDNI